MILKVVKIFSLLAFALVSAQTTFPENGVADKRPERFALINATVVVSFEKKLEGADILIQKDRIEAIGTDIVLPEDAVVYDMSGKYIYPSFIDLYSGYGIEISKTGGTGTDGTHRPQFLSDKKGAYGWNEAIKTEVDAASLFQAKPDKAKDWRSLGFGAVVTHLQDGIARGSGCLVSLSDKKENELILRENAAAFFSFSKGSSTQDYPSSLMGSIALLRQTFYDGQWYAFQKNKEQLNLSLENWNKQLSLPKIFAAGDKLSVLRADRIADEFQQPFILKTNGDEYQRLAEIKATGAPLIIPLNFPPAYDVADPYDAYYLSMAALKHWEMAPYNAAMLADAGIAFAFTTDGLKEAKDFMPHLRKAIKCGLSESMALRALTWEPAGMIQALDILGSLEAGKLANFLVCSGSLFDEKTVLFENWVAGKAFVINELPPPDMSGKYDLTLAGEKTVFQLEVVTKDNMPEMKIVETDSIKWEIKSKISDQKINLSYWPNKDKKGDQIRLSGWIEGETWKGTGYNEKGEWIAWQVKNRRTLDPAKNDSINANKSKNKGKNDSIITKGKMIYPFLAYGYESQPPQEDVLIINATVWTNEKEGILDNADVYIKSGKIARVGKNLGLEAQMEIDATGKHITSGIIDEHSHIAISRGVNEWTQASSAEVRIGDVVNSEDINIYRQLASGVTAAQLLHGSANPIGGQSAIIKLRWGLAPEKMKIEGADEFIKFALGENVKQSNAGDVNVVRFPQSRTGVEQVYSDYFTRAKEYDALSKNKKLNPRRDIEMEAISEIINKKRFITCHSYVQSEINMLMKMAENFNFRINTFTHILEGYKLADRMKEHGVTGSSFADWWMYKYEVMDAIPYNATILNRMSVNTCINSDDAEMARRLNTEAAKTVKYGGTSEEDALKMITLNPAKALHLDERMGSIKEGKDADLVIWSDHPLSVYARAEKTFVDGRCYYDEMLDLALREDIRLERTRLIQKMLSEKSGSAKQSVKDEPKMMWHCEDRGDYGH